MVIEFLFTRGHGKFDYVGTVMAGGNHVCAVRMHKYDS